MSKIALFTCAFVVSRILVSAPSFAQDQWSDPSPVGSVVHNDSELFAHSIAHLVQTADKPSAPNALRTPTKSYEVVSIKPNEVIVRIAPHYVQQEVSDPVSGQHFTRMTFEGGIPMAAAGAAEAQKLVLPFLSPSREAASVDVLEQSLDVIPNVDLAPVPTFVKNHDDYTKFYIPGDGYNTTQSSELFTVQPAQTFRTAYTQNVVVSAVQYDAATKSVTRVRSLTLRIRFNGVSASSKGVAPQEAELFQKMFVNGSVAQFYTVASQAQVLRTKGARAMGASDGQWLELETPNEGVYRITAQDLASNGISVTDANSIELFGIGGQPLSEQITDSTGEWIETPIELHTDGSNFRDFYFYAPGTTIWKYNGGQDMHVDGLYHKINTYSTTGHYLLKVGGSRLGNGLRIATAPDSPTLPLTPSNRVFTAVTHEVERTLEFGDLGREYLGEVIPRNDVGKLEFDMQAPGNTGDSTAIRIGFDASVDSGDTGSVTVWVNGQQTEAIDARPIGCQDCPTTRDWDNIAHLNNIGTNLHIGLNFSSSSIAAAALLDFVELMYKRSTDIGQQSIPFFVIDSNTAWDYTFTNATGGEVWDVTNGGVPHVVAMAEADKITAPIQGDYNAIRRFFAFSSQSLATPTFSKISAPSLRTSIGSTGATEIIITPTAFLDQANELKALRERGGEATEPMSAAVVVVEDIYREFGYGSHGKDPSAIRDFLAYMLRHASTKPLYVLLFGGGHCDVLNRMPATASIQNYIPIWETPDLEYLGTYRTQIGESTPDDSYYGRLQPGDNGSTMEMAIGRVPVFSVDGAEAFVQKAKKYEHGSDSGAWRTIASFLADDRIADKADKVDGLDHLGETESEVSVMPDRVGINKIYEVSYPTVYAQSGRRKPEVEQALVDAINNGSLVLSFVGHGNPNVWTHESVLNVPSTIDKFHNFDRLTYLTASTCDFSRYDDFSYVSGGVLFVIKPDAGAIGALGTSRSVTEESVLVKQFYQTLFNESDATLHGTSTAGEALLAAKRAAGPYASNLQYYYLLGDPAQRLLLPKEYVTFDSLNSMAVDTGHLIIPALSELTVSGSIRPTSDPATTVDRSFNGTVTVTLFDSPTLEQATTNFTIDPPYHDKYWIEGPILYRGRATVTDGRFSIQFVVPRDVKLDGGAVKLSGYAYGIDTRTALGDTKQLTLSPSDSALTVVDTSGPTLKIYLGTRAFQSGDDVSMHSTAIVDVHDTHGLNTSTASIGHSFIAWVDDAQDSAIDLASTYVSNPNDFTNGSSVHPIELPAGHHTLHVRAFDTFDNPAFGSVDFVAKKDAPFRLYEVTNDPNPIFDHTTFRFTQPGAAGTLVHIDLTLYTTDGRHVRTLNTDTQASSVELAWDGRDDAGIPVANGVYIFQIDARDLDDGSSTSAEGKCIMAR